MLPRSQRLVAAADHRLVARRGRRCRRGSVVVKCVVSDSCRPAKLAVVVPKPVGSAPVRNRLRRQLQHLAAPHMTTLPVGSLVVVRAESGAETSTFAALGESLSGALAKLLAS